MKVYRKMQVSHTPGQHALSHGDLLVGGEVGDSGEAVRVTVCLGASGGGGGGRGRLGETESGEEVRETKGGNNSKCNIKFFV